MRLLLCALGVCLAAQAAEPRIAVSELVTIVTSRLATDRNDQRIANAISSVRLREHLGEPVIESLAQMGAGRITVRVLRALGKHSASLPEPSVPPIAGAPAPSSDEQTALAGEIRGWSRTYLAGLPDFVCTRTVRQFHNYEPALRRQAPTYPGESDVVFDQDGIWRAADSFSGETTYVGGRDSYRISEINGRAPRGSVGQLLHEYSWGEFGGLMVEILDPSRAATLEWDRWEVLRGRRMAVFRYSVDLRHSRYSMSASATRQSSEVAHVGFIYADPQSGAVQRLVLYAAGLTEQSPMSAVGAVLDYGEVSIAGGNYLLPLSAVSYQRARLRETREEIEFTNYRKFESSSTITFDSK